MGNGALLDWFVAHLRTMMAARGYRIVGDEAGGAGDEAGGIALHPVDPHAPRAYRRKSRAIFVAGLAEMETVPEDVLQIAYPLLVRSLSNLFILLAHHDGATARPQAHFITLERGHYALPYLGDDRAFFEAVLERLAPLATSRLIIDNEFHPDLPEELWEGDEHTEAIYRAGRRLQAMELIPTPFPMEELLPARDYRHIQRLFGLGGLSYGNVSTRKDEGSFWMSASGVDKSHLRTVGREILLVTGYDPKKGAIQLSVPPHRQPRRVSVDAIEHLTIYREHPDVGAILHIHAWMDGIASTEINYPCGTLELAQAVAQLVRQAEDPARAVIGLKNHGLTITGPNLDEIFARLEGRIRREVPMS